PRPLRRCALSSSPRSVTAATPPPSPDPTGSRWCGRYGTTTTSPAHSRSTRSDDAASRTHSPTRTWPDRRPWPPDCAATSSGTATWPRTSCRSPATGADPTGPGARAGAGTSTQAAGTSTQTLPGVRVEEADLPLLGDQLEVLALAGMVGRLGTVDERVTSRRRTVQVAVRAELLHQIHDGPHAVLTRRRQTQGFGAHADGDPGAGAG